MRACRESPHDNDCFEWCFSCISLVFHFFLVFVCLTASCFCLCFYLKSNVRIPCMDLRWPCQTGCHPFWWWFLCLEWSSCFESSCFEFVWIVLTSHDDDFLLLTTRRSLFHSFMMCLWCFVSHPQSSWSLVLVVVDAARVWWPQFVVLIIMTCCFRMTASYHLHYMLLLLLLISFESVTKGFQVKGFVAATLSLKQREWTFVETSCLDLIFLGQKHWKKEWMKRVNHFHQQIL